jgi:hypothetical protein
MRTRGSLARVLVALFAAAAVGVALPGAAAAAAAPMVEPGTRISAVPATQEFFWDWSDGVDSKVRTFREGKYHAQKNLPQLVVTAKPASPQQYIKLQYKFKGAWKREDAATTNGSGVARLEMNPYCTGGDWCEATYSYRLYVNGVYTVFKITFAK